MKSKKIVTIGFLFCLMCAMTGCKSNVSDVTVYMNGGTPEAKFKSYITSGQAVTGSANINDIYNSYVFDNKTYYRNKNLDEYDFENKNVEFMDGEVLKVSLKKLTMGRNNKPNILDHKIVVKMNGPVIETNGTVGDDNSTVIFNNPENLDEVYAYTEIGKKELNKEPVLSIKNKREYYNRDNLPEFEVEEGKYATDRSKDKLKFYLNNKSVDSDFISSEEFKPGLNKVYAVNEYGIKSNVIEFNYDKIEYSTNKYKTKIIIKTYSGLKSLKTNKGKTKINIKKLKHKGNKYYVPVNLITYNITVTTKSGIKEKCAVKKKLVIR